MKRCTVVFITLVATVLLLAARERGGTSLLTLVNKNERDDVHVQLYGINDRQYYYLTEPAFEHPDESIFEIHKDVYLLAVYACGMKRTGTLNLMKNVRLVFPICFVNAANSDDANSGDVYAGDSYRGAPNAGEPTLEKVDLLKTEPQDGAMDENLLLSLETSGRLQDGIRDPELARALYPPYSAQIHWRLDWYNWVTTRLDAHEYLDKQNSTR